MGKPRMDLANLVVLPGGDVLIVGGARTAEIYDPVTKAFSAASGTLERSRWFQSATLLSDGKVLILGGADEKGRATAQAWIYTF